MTYYKKDNVFKQFFENREYLIAQFKKGDLTKREFIEEHFYFIQRLNLKPFKYRIDSFEKGLYNYQYYNMLAKYNYMKSKDKKIIEKHPTMAQEFRRKANHFYMQKDKSTLKLLRYLEFENVEAYYIKVKSKELDGKLFEIVLKDYDNVILHSISPWLADELRNEWVFEDKKKKSLIDKYINERY
ncbi:DUF6648 family protein [Anaeromicrobium sediminis]|uniref:Uncharacterized protein n=1 Tax=Anaeromicrobium sediminis TaxID=1478221 RepID=A0A267MM34_9FIRM|nr:DUF6648 family protein [Anaeromicrobium sediminis]PAB60664.1 hypothetical protein CCE28_03740 [Anaeromicrobium sediminis]